MTISRRSIIKGGFAGASASLIAAGATGAVMSGAAIAAAPKKKNNKTGFIVRKVGDIEVTALLDGYLDVKTELLTGYNSKQAVPVRRDAFLSADGPVTIPVSAYLVNTGSKLILIDAGTADALVPTLGVLPESIKAAGYSADQIDTVLVTHMHPDHVYGLIDPKGNKLFPNAEIVIPEVEHKFWMDDSNMVEQTKAFFMMARKAVAPYKKNIKLVSQTQEVAPGITAVPAPGHTPGHTAYIISSGKDSMFVTGDVVHVAALQFAFPEWAIAFDIDQKLAIQTRKKILDQASADRLLIAGMHLPFPGFGYASKDKSSYRFVPAEWQYG